VKALVTVISSDSLIMYTVARN